MTIADVTLGETEISSSYCVYKKNRQPLCFYKIKTFFPSYTIIHLLRYTTTQIQHSIQSNALPNATPYVC